MAYKILRTFIGGPLDGQILLLEHDCVLLHVTGKRIDRSIMRHEYRAITKGKEPVMEYVGETLVGRTS